jgi:predicted nucleic acid-binding protein
MKLYTDSNFVVRLYLKLHGYEGADELLDRARERGCLPLPVPWLTEREVLNALHLAPFQSRAQGPTRITDHIAGAASASFHGDLAARQLLAQQPVPWDRLGTQFDDLVLRHTARRGFRTYDILHVASALVLRCDTFWSFDDRAKKLAKLEGLKTN